MRRTSRTSGTLAWPVLAPAPALLLASLLSSACATTQGGAEQAASQGRRVETVSVGSSQGGALSAVEVETGAAIVDSVVAVSPVAAWAALPAVFETLGVEATTVDTRARAMGNERFTASRLEGRSLSDYIDCGTSFGRARADQYQVTMQILVQVGRDPSGGTRLRTLLDAYAQPRDVSGNAYHCASTGRLERRVADLIAQRAGA